MQLDKFQKNDIFLAIAETELDSAEFELSFDGSEHKTLLDYKRSSAFLTISHADYGNVWIEYEVADGPRQSSVDSEDEWLPTVKNWLAVLKRDLETPDRPMPELPVSL